MSQMAIDGAGRYVTLLADVIQAAGHVQVVRSSSYRSPVIAKALAIMGSRNPLRHL